MLITDSKTKVSLTKKGNLISFIGQSNDFFYYFHQIKFNIVVANEQNLFCTFRPENITI